MLPFRTILRLLLGTLVLLGLGAAARAQEQDRKLQDRLTRPNMSLTYDTSQSTFGKPGVFANGKVTSKVATNDFNTRGFVAHEFLAKPYAGPEKKSWLANLNFFTKKADTKGKYEIPNAGEAFATKNSPTKEAAGVSKVMDTTAYASTDLHYLKRNRFDASPNRTASTDPNKPVGYTGDMKPMSIDDVRELLNKNK